MAGVPGWVPLNPLPPLAALFPVHFELWFPFSRRIEVCLSCFMIAHGFWYTKSAPCFLDMLEDFFENGFAIISGGRRQVGGGRSHSVCCPDPARAVSVPAWPPSGGWMEAAWWGTSLPS